MLTDCAKRRVATLQLELTAGARRGDRSEPHVSLGRVGKAERKKERLAQTAAVRERGVGRPRGRARAARSGRHSSGRTSHRRSRSRRISSVVRGGASTSSPACSTPYFSTAVQCQLDSRFEHVRAFVGDMQHQAIAAFVTRENRHRLQRRAPGSGTPPWVVRGASITPQPALLHRSRQNQTSAPRQDERWRRHSANAFAMTSPEATRLRAR